MDSDKVVRTKTLTTPHDLSQCLFDGLRKASEAIYGREDLEALLLSTAAIRYSTTQASRTMFGEGAAIEDCRLVYTLEATGADGKTVEPALQGRALPPGIEPGTTLSVTPALLT
ncbi:hypothetical protein [Burkholderia sp. BCC1993]|uniref:hypothetical protein n=1 Tax=Burkholderia sp. BCC1993 TaxID=2817444 RepID=UPI002AAFB0C0|nr:hypothetical protein [Burkholderia sp. BCC1993]